MKNTGLRNRLYACLGLLFLCGCASKKGPGTAVAEHTPAPVLPAIEPQFLEAKETDIPLPVGYEFEGEPRAEFKRYTGKLSVPQVIDFYQKQMDVLGWAIEDHSAGSEGLLWCRKPHRECIVSVRETGEGSSAIVLFKRESA